MQVFAEKGRQSSRSLLAQNWKLQANELLGRKGVVALRKTPELASQRFVLFPDDTCIQMWSVVITVLMVYTATITPYRVALVDVDSDAWVVLDAVIDSLFGLDVCINCFLCFYDDDSILVISHRGIFLHYLRTWMLPDVLACVPFQLILQANSSYNNMIKLVRLPRAYKLIKLAKLFRIMKIIKNRNRIMVYVNSVLRIGLSFERLLWFFLWLLLLLHLFSCAWIFFGKLNDMYSDNWIMCRGYSDKELWDLYIVAMYFSVTTLATVGYGDITPCNNTERVVCSVMMLVGILVYSIVIGSLTNILVSLDRRKAVLNGKLTLLMELAGKYNLSKLFYHKLTQAIEYEHRNSPKELEDLVNGLPSTLRTQLLIAIYCKMIEHNAFFDGKTEHFVAWVAPQLTPCRIVEEEYVYKESDPAVEMFFIVRGEVEYVLLHISEEPGYHTVKFNYYFGEEDLLFSASRLHLFTVKTTANSEFLALSRDHFEELLQTFESEALDILSQTEQRRIRLLAHRRDAEAAADAKAEVIRHVSAPKKLSIPIAMINNEDKERETSISEEAPSVGRPIAELKRFASIDLLQRSDTMSSVQKTKTAVMQYAIRKENHANAKEIQEMWSRILRMDDVIGSIEEQLKVICLNLGAALSFRAVQHRESASPELPPYLATIEERGSREMD